MRRLTIGFLAVAVIMPIGCSRPGTPVPATNNVMMVCGQRIHVGAPVVLWTDPGGYDAYRAECRFIPDRVLPVHPGDDSPSAQRYDTYRRNIPPEVKEHVCLHGWDLALLQQYVDLFVIHYDACGTSENCFQVLHDKRGLSVHFLLDLDGTIYQTLDLKERAWHAGTANDRSIGIEIANKGAYRDLSVLDDWYARDASGRLHVTVPAVYEDGGAVRTPNAGIRTPNFIARPARNEPVCGTVQGGELCQYDFTEEQYRSLIKLTAALCRVFPKISCDYPRNENGGLRTTALSSEELKAYHGLLGHWHITQQKVDPGPAFDWDRLIREAKP